MDRCYSGKDRQVPWTGWSWSGSVWSYIPPAGQSSIAHTQNLQLWRHILAIVMVTGQTLTTTSTAGDVSPTTSREGHLRETHKHQTSCNRMRRCKFIFIKKDRKRQWYLRVVTVFSFRPGTGRSISNSVRLTHTINITVKTIRNLMSHNSFINSRNRNYTKSTQWSILCTVGIMVHSSTYT